MVKKILSLILSGLLLISLVGCKKPKNTEVDEPLAEAVGAESQMVIAMNPQIAYSSGAAYQAFKEISSTLEQDMQTTDAYTLSSKTPWSWISYDDETEEWISKQNIKVAAWQNLDYENKNEYPYSYTYKDNSNTALTPYISSSVKVSGYEAGSTPKEGVLISVTGKAETGLGFVVTEDGDISITDPSQGNISVVQRVDDLETHGLENDECKRAAQVIIYHNGKALWATEFGNPHYFGGNSENEGVYVSAFPKLEKIRVNKGDLISIVVKNLSDTRTPLNLIPAETEKYREASKLETANGSSYITVGGKPYLMYGTLGIPHNTNFVLTTIDDLKTVADDFADSVIMLHGITDYGAISNKINGKWDLSSKIGKMSDYRELEKTAEIFPYSELTRFDKQTLFCNSIFHSARAVTGKSLQEYYYNPATGLAEGQSSYLLRASKLSYFAEKYIRSLNKSNITSAAPVSLGNSPYTDNMRSDREATKNEMIKALKSFKNNNISVLLSNPDGYALAYADKLLSLPTGSSGHRLLDFDIPFAQMVIGKYISYSSEPINLCGDMESAVLNAAASGSSLSFAISGSSYDNIMDTDLDFLYSADYSLLREQAKSLSEEYSKRLNSTAGSYITDFAVLEDGITQTCFSNGQSILVNRTNKEYVNGETVIEAKDYILFGGGVS